MKLSHRITTAVAMLFAAAGSLAAQGATQNGAAADPQQRPVAATPAVEQAPVSAPATQEAVSLAPFAANNTVGIHQLTPSAPVP